jgi:hypothetical protein
MKFAMADLTVNPSGFQIGKDFNFQRKHMAICISLSCAASPNQARKNQSIPDGRPMTCDSPPWNADSFNVNILLA